MSYVLVYYSALFFLVFWVYWLANPEQKIFRRAAVGLIVSFFWPVLLAVALVLAIVSSFIPNAQKNV